MEGGREFFDGLKTKIGIWKSGIPTKDSNNVEEGITTVRHQLLGKGTGIIILSRLLIDLFQQPQTIISRSAANSNTFTTDNCLLAIAIGYLIIIIEWKEANMKMAISSKNPNFGLHPEQKMVANDGSNNAEHGTTCCTNEGNMVDHTTDLLEPSFTLPNQEESAILEELKNQPLFTIKQNEYGNLSVYALDFIPKHTLLLSELPVLRGHEIDIVTLLHESGTHQCQADDDAYMQHDLGIDESKCASIWDLHDQYVDTYTPNTHPLSAPNEKRILGIIKSNAHYSNDEGGRGLYLTMSRFNHSCRPNVGYGFNGWEMRLYTSSDVEAGEELCQCYSDMVYFCSRIERREYLQRKFNFDCVCRGCSNDGDDEQLLNESDTRRERLRFLAKALSQRDRTSIINESDLGMVLESIQIMALESLEHNISSTYRLAREWALQLGVDEASLEECGLSAEVYARLLELSKGKARMEILTAQE